MPPPSPDGVEEVAQIERREGVARGPNLLSVAVGDGLCQATLGLVDAATDRAEVSLSKRVRSSMPRGAGDSRTAHARLGVAHAAMAHGPLEEAKALFASALTTI